MNRGNLRNYRATFWRLVTFCALFAALCLAFSGCSSMKGYSTESLFPDNIGSVYLEMFGNQSLERGVEYELTDALAKRIETDTPYKIVSSRDRADTLMSGQITSVGTTVLTTERQTGRALEKEVELQALVSWKNLKTGELLLDNVFVNASATYSEWQNQGFRYASTLGANNLARKIVESMEKQW
jgi:hypothetical protein